MSSRNPFIFGRRGCEELEKIDETIDVEITNEKHFEVKDEFSNKYCEVDTTNFVCVDDNLVPIIGSGQIHSFQLKDGEKLILKSKKENPLEYGCWYIMKIDNDENPVYKFSATECLCIIQKSVDGGIAFKIISEGAIGDYVLASEDDNYNYCGLIIVEKITSDYKTFKTIVPQKI